MQKPGPPAQGQLILDESAEGAKWVESYLRAFSAFLSP